MSTTPWGAIIDASNSTLNNIANNITQMETNNLEYQRFLENRRYNEPVNQVDRLKAAGLNPVLSSGGYQMSPSPPSMASPRIDSQTNFAGAQAMMQREESLEISRQKLDMQRAFNDIKIQLARQGLEKGELDLALKALLLDQNTQMSPYLIDEVIARAGIAQNKKGISDYDFMTYPAYREGILANLDARTNQSVALANYWLGKPGREWKQLSLIESAQEEAARHNSMQERISQASAKWSHDDRLKVADIALKQYNLAVRRQDWDEAHYWYDMVKGVVGEAAKVASSYAGWKFGLPIDKWW